MQTNALISALVFLERYFPPAIASNNLGVIYERLGYPSKARGMFPRHWNTILAWPWPAAT
ncbi:hypothetical protein DSCO28_39310 [Desulfosarcina ovata subsp. sediminis]|uniref:Uncharacterized protein n=1 Tax=Desulfosarcina ovata subsp. sediminis TaxID=885957 RepID=A0A5K7ZT35_9BACT|nr:hypothetical protein [Desulfosarcina ovata]BBO83365.1 hypothetical protein DSCO28_39310 [Desulfosarcina ovata subsp. sediminis]